MKRRFYIFLCLLCFCSIHSLYGFSDEHFILSVIDSIPLELDVGPGKLHEDIDEFEVLRGELGATAIGYSQIPRGVIREQEGNAFFNFIQNGVVILDESRESFINRLYLSNSFAYTDDDGSLQWVPRYYGNNRELAIIPPAATRNPGLVRLIRCFVGNWRYLAPVNDPGPDDISCSFPELDLCDPNICRIVEVTVWCEDENDYVDEEQMVHVPSDGVPVYSDFYSLMDIRTAAAVEHTMTQPAGSAFDITIHDRTPPNIIVSGMTGILPTLGGTIPATTGDWYRVNEIRFRDNYSGVHCMLMVGRVEDPGQNAVWQEHQDWFKLPVDYFPRNSPLENQEFIIMPNMVHGFMGYTIFLWDDDGNLNPGDSGINSGYYRDDPSMSYGLGAALDHIFHLQNPFIGNLGKNPGFSNSWHAHLRHPDPSNPQCPKLDPRHRRAEGILNVRDNDLPNIVIRIDSMAISQSGDPLQEPIFFPPVTGVASISITESSLLDPLYYTYPDLIESSVATIEPNLEQYRLFLSPPADEFLAPSPRFFHRNIKSGEAPLYFKVLDVSPPDPLSSNGIQYMSPYDSAQLERFLYNATTQQHTDEQFLREHFRLQDYFEYDTDTSGEYILGNLPEDRATFGARNSFGAEVTVVLTEQLFEDAEYLISVWADDNVKWANIDSAGQLLSNAKTIPSGIASGTVVLRIPNQHPAVTHVRELGPQRSVIQPIRAVFREPTVPLNSDDPEDFENQRYPYISVAVEDEAGLTRKITLFLKITDERPDVRVIERRHGQR